MEPSIREAWAADPTVYIRRLETRVRELTSTVASLNGEKRVLQATVSNQARALMELTEDVPPWAPSLAIIYWLYGPTRWGTKSWITEQNRLKPLIRHFGDLKAAKLTPAVWAQYIAQRRLEPHRKGPAPADFLLNLELGRAKQLLTWGVSNNLLKFNPLLHCKALRAVCRRETWLPLSDVDRLLDACDTVVDRRLPEGDDDGLRAKCLRAYVLMCHDSMLRPGEAANLARGRIGTGGRVELASRTTKGAKRRTVFLTPRTLESIQALPQADGRVFPVTRRQLSYWFRALCEAAGVDALAAPGEGRIRAHDLRASGATTLDEKGVGATAIRDAMGHSQVSTTEIYLRSEKASNAYRATEKMTEVTDGRIGPKRAGSRKKLEKRVDGRDSFRHS